MEMYDNRNFSFFPVSHFAEDKKLVIFTMFSWNHILLLSIVLLIKGKGYVTIQFTLVLHAHIAFRQIIYIFLPNGKMVHVKEM